MVLKQYGKLYLKFYYIKYCLYIVNMNNFLVKTIIQPSTIEGAGTGRFFVEDQKKGTIIRKQKIGSESLYVIKNKEELSKYNLQLLKHFGHSKPKHSELKTNYVYLNFPPMNTNHSEDNNIDFIYVHDEKITYLTKDVKAGDEMFQNYRNFEKVHWFEEYLHEKGEISARELGMLIDSLA